MDLPITIKRARKVLREEAADLSDEQLQEMIEQISVLAAVAIKLVPKSRLGSCKDSTEGGE